MSKALTRARATLVVESDGAVVLRFAHDGSAQDNDFHAVGRAIVLIERAEQTQRAGKARADAVTRATSIRHRKIRTAAAYFQATKDGEPPTRAELQRYLADRGMDVSTKTLQRILGGR
jgi:hypothetical protein